MPAKEIIDPRRHALKALEQGSLGKALLDFMEAWCAKNEGRLPGPEIAKELVNGVVAATVSVVAMAPPSVRDTYALALTVSILPLVKMGGSIVDEELGKRAATEAMRKVFGEHNVAT